jgi:hypothetical protein
MNHRRLACAFIFVLIFVQNLYDRSLAYGLVLSERLKNDTLTSELSLIKDELAYLQSEIKKLTLLTTQRSVSSLCFILCSVLLNEFRFG